MIHDETINITKEQFISEVSNFISKEEFSPTKQIYVEWTYLQDIYIGSIISLCKNQEEYNYVLNNLEKYNDRILRDHSLYFPKLKLSEDQLETFIKDSKNSKLLLYRSPLTNIFINFKELIEFIYDKNHKFGDDSPITIIINIYPLPITEEFKLYIKHVREYLKSAIKIGIVSSPIQKLDLSMLLSSDILLIDRFDYFLKDEHSKTCQAFFDDPFPQFFNKTIITPKVIDNEEVKKNVLNLSEKELDRIFEITTDLCNIGCNFKFVNPIIYKQENKSK